jgi:hypothetical protein
MVIKRVDDRRVQFHVVSPQINGFICDAEGAAELNGPELVYQDRDPNSEDFGSGVRFNVQDGKVVLRVFTGPGVTRVPFCRAHGDLSGVAFSLHERRELKQQPCSPCSRL